MGGALQASGKAGGEPRLHRDKVAKPRLEVKFSDFHTFADAAPPTSHLLSPPPFLPPDAVASATYYLKGHLHQVVPHLFIWM